MTINEAIAKLEKAKANLPWGGDSHLHIHVLEEGIESDYHGGVEEIKYDKDRVTIVTWKKYW